MPLPKSTQRLNSAEIGLNSVFCPIPVVQGSVIIVRKIIYGAVSAVGSPKTCHAHDMLRARRGPQSRMCAATATGVRRPLAAHVGHRSN